MLIVVTFDKQNMARTRVSHDADADLNSDEDENYPILGRVRVTFFRRGYQLLHFEYGQAGLASVDMMVSLLQCDRVVLQFCNADFDLKRTETETLSDELLWRNEGTTTLFFFESKTVQAWLNIFGDHILWQQEQPEYQQSQHDNPLVAEFPLR